MRDHAHFMRLALEQAALAAAEGEIPVGAVLVRAGEVVTAACNARERLCDPTAHAELLALRQGAALLGTRRLSDCTLYVTLEPCPMCAGAMIMACLGQCLFAAADPAQGCCESCYALTRDPAFSWRVPCIGGLLAEEAQAQLTAFFAARRNPDAPQPPTPTLPE